MRSRSWFLAVLVLVLLPLCVRVWADPPLRQVASRVYLPGVMRGWPPVAVADVGDAPDSSNSRGAPMTAYPGVPAQFPSVIGPGSPPPGPLHRNAPLLFCLGSRVTAESEADSGLDADGVNNLDPSADRADLDGADDGLLPTGALTHCTAVTLRFNVTAWAGAPQEVFLNVWADWDHNGRWGGVQQCPAGNAPEWAVRNQVVPLLAPGLYTLTTTAFVAYNPYPEKPMWLRLTLSNFAAPDTSDDGSGPPGGYCYGETEDYLLPGQTAQPTPTHGYTPQPTYTTGPKPTATNTPIPPPCVTAPTLISPTNGAVLNTLVPVFRFDTGVQWNADHFELQVARDAAFSSMRYTASGPADPGVNEYDLHANLEPGVKFYWRARLKCGQTQAPWSAVWSFTTASGGTLPPAPTLTSPISGTLLTSWPVTLTWSAVPGAVEYHPAWRKPSTPNVTFGQWTSDTQAQARNLDPGTLYEWSVATRSGYGIGPSSAWWRFTTPSTPPPAGQALPPGMRRRVEQDGSVWWEDE